MGNQNADVGKGQGQEKNIQNPGQNPNAKTPQQGQGQSQSKQPQQGFNKNSPSQNPSRDTDSLRTGALNDEADDGEVSEKVGKEDLYGNRKDQGGSMGRSEKH